MPQSSLSQSSFLFLDTNMETKLKKTGSIWFVIDGHSECLHLAKLLVYTSGKALKLCRFYSNINTAIIQQSRGRTAGHLEAQTTSLSWKSSSQSPQFTGVCGLWLRGGCSSLPFIFRCSLQVTQLSAQVLGFLISLTVWFLSTLFQRITWAE